MDGIAGSAEDRLYALMEVAERQQALAQAALEGLAAERATLWLCYRILGSPALAVLSFRGWMIT